MARLLHADMSYYDKVLGLVPPNTPFAVDGSTEEGRKEIARLEDLGFVIIGEVKAAKKTATQAEIDTEPGDGDVGDGDAGDESEARMKALAASPRRPKPGGRRQRPATARARAKAQAAGMDPDEYTARENAQS